MIALTQHTCFIHSYTVDEDGSILSPSFQEIPESWPIENDDDVIKTFDKADDYFQNNQDILKRPSVLVFVSKDPNAPLAPPPPPYLQHLADPSQSDTMTMLSFYAFPPSGIENPDDFAVMLRNVWKPFHALGRVYVAQEGVNAQMSIPTNV